jgi:hypothetical protein
MTTKAVIFSAMLAAIFPERNSDPVVPQPPSLFSPVDPFSSLEQMLTGNLLPSASPPSQAVRAKIDLIKVVLKNFPGSFPNSLYIFVSRYQSRSFRFACGG